MSDINIKFKSYDGYMLEGTLNKSPNERGGLLFVHGITSTKDEMGFHSGFAEFLSENGITSFRFDYRFHGNGDTSLEYLSLAGIVNDIDAAYEVLQKHVDTRKVPFFIVGTSFGGGLAAYWVDSQQKHEIKKIVLNAPVINYENDVLERNGLIKDGMLSIEAQRELEEFGYVTSSDIHFGRCLINELRLVNGIQALCNLGARIVIYHGSDDDDVPIESSQKYKSDFTDLEIIQGVGHGFGIENDDDLDFPETKAIHKAIYKSALRYMENTI